MILKLSENGIQRLVERKDEYSIVQLLSEPKSILNQETLMQIEISDGYYQHKKVFIIGIAIPKHKQLKKYMVLKVHLSKEKKQDIIIIDDFIIIYQNISKQIGFPINFKKFQEGITKNPQGCRDIPQECFQNEAQFLQPKTLFTDNDSSQEKKQQHSANKSNINKELSQGKVSSLKQNIIDTSDQYNYLDSEQDSLFSFDNFINKAKFFKSTNQITRNISQNNAYPLVQNNFQQKQQQNQDKGLSSLQNLQHKNTSAQQLVNNTTLSNQKDLLEQFNEQTQINKIQEQSCLNKMNNSNQASKSYEQIKLQASEQPQNNKLPQIIANQQINLLQKPQKAQEQIENILLQNGQKLTQNQIQSKPNEIVKQQEIPKTQIINGQQNKTQQEQNKLLDDNTNSKFIPQESKEDQENINSNPQEPQNTKQNENCGGFNNLRMKIQQYQQKNKKQTDQQSVESFLSSNASKNQNSDQYFNMQIPQSHQQAQVLQSEVKHTHDTFNKVEQKSEQIRRLFLNKTSTQLLNKFKSPSPTNKSKTQNYQSFDTKIPIPIKKCSKAIQQDQEIKQSEKKQQEQIPQNKNNQNGVAINSQNGSQVDHKISIEKNQKQEGDLKLKNQNNHLAKADNMKQQTITNIFNDVNSTKPQNPQNQSQNIQPLKCITPTKEGKEAINNEIKSTTLIFSKQIKSPTMEFNQKMLDESDETSQDFHFFSNKENQNEQLNGFVKASTLKQSVNKQNLNQDQDKDDEIKMQKDNIIEQITQNITKISSIDKHQSQKSQQSSQSKKAKKIQEKEQQNTERDWMYLFEAIEQDYSDDEDQKIDNTVQNNDKIQTIKSSSIKLSQENESLIESISQSYEKNQQEKDRIEVQEQIIQQDCNDQLANLDIHDKQDSSNQQHNQSQQKNSPLHNKLNIEVEQQEQNIEIQQEQQQQQNIEQEIQINLNNSLNPQEEEKMTPPISSKEVNERMEIEQNIDCQSLNQEQNLIEQQMTNAINAQNIEVQQIEQQITIVESEKVSEDIEFQFQFQDQDQDIDFNIDLENSLNEIDSSKQSEEQKLIDTNKKPIIDNDPKEKINKNMILIDESSKKLELNSINQMANTSQQQIIDNNIHLQQNNNTILKDESSSQLDLKSIKEIKNAIEQNQVDQLNSQPSIQNINEESISLIKKENSIDQKQLLSTSKSLDNKNESLSTKNRESKILQEDIDKQMTLFNYRFSKGQHEELNYSKFNKKQLSSSTTKTNLEFNQPKINQTSLLSVKKQFKIPSQISEGNSTTNKIENTQQLLNKKQQDKTKLDPKANRNQFNQYKKIDKLSTQNKNVIDLEGITKNQNINQNKIDLEINHLISKENQEILNTSKDKGKQQQQSLLVIEKEKGDKSNNSKKESLNQILNQNQISILSNSIQEKQKSEEKLQNEKIKKQPSQEIIIEDDVVIMEELSFVKESPIKKSLSQDLNLKMQDSYQSNEILDKYSQSYSESQPNNILKRKRKRISKAFSNSFYEFDESLIIIEDDIIDEGNNNKLKSLKKFKKEEISLTVDKNQNNSNNQKDKYDIMKQNLLSNTSSPTKSTKKRSLIKKSAERGFQIQQEDDVKYEDQQEEEWDIHSNFTIDEDLIEIIDD